MSSTSNFFILEDGPVASPGACLICGYSGKDRLFTDPRKDFDEYGSVILCELCVGAMAQDYGYERPAQVRALVMRIKEAEAELEILRSAVAHVENLNAAVNDLNSLRDAIIDRSVGVPSNAGSPEPVDDTTGYDELDFDGFFEREPEIDEPVSEPRPDDVSTVAARTTAYIEL